MDVTQPLGPFTRAAWRAWLAEHHGRSTEAWLLSSGQPPRQADELTELDSVEEALCFGWIDGLAKKHGAFTARRFTPRRPRSNWTELNKERARRLLAAGRMTEAGLRVLPDLDPAAWCVAPDIQSALQAEPGTWLNFQRFPGIYQRVRVGYLEDVRRRDPAEFARRLKNLVEKTRDNVMFGAWDDTKLPRTEG